MRYCLLVLLFLAQLACAQDVTFPAGWRNPSKAELGESWRESCVDDCVWLMADFDGDNILDLAYLAVNEKRRSFGILVLVSTDSKIGNWRILGETRPLSDIGGMGIAITPAGDHRVMCDIKKEVCGPDRKKPMHLTYPGIDFFASEGANSIFVWNKRTRKFVRVWQSD